jgi:glycosyltransferase involved in cell wall biosynthesis
MTAAGNGVEPRRVLMTVDTPGGVWPYALELAGGLSARGLEVVLATLGAPLNREQRAEVAALPGLEVHESDFRLEWMEDPWDDVRRSGEWLLEIAARVRPDIVHLNGYAHAALPFGAPVVVVAHSCVLSWWRAVHHEPAPAAWSRYAREVSLGLRSATLVMAPSQAMARLLPRLYGPLQRVLVVPNGRDPQRFPQGRKEPFIFSAGRLWDAGKNAAALDAIAPRALWPIYVAGESVHPDGGGAGTRHLHGLGPLPTAELATWLARASIYALPARYEPFGLSILEAALAGCALVLGDIPSLRENWAGAAAFVLPEDPSALAATLHSLCTDAHRRDTLAARGRERALQFSPARMVLGYLGAYREALRARRAAPQPTGVAV